MLSVAVSVSPPVSVTVTVHVTDVGAVPESESTQNTLTFLSNASRRQNWCDKRNYEIKDITNSEI